MSSDCFIWLVCTESIFIYSSIREDMQNCFFIQYPAPLPTINSEVLSLLDAKIKYEFYVILVFKFRKRCSLNVYLINFLCALFLFIFSLSDLLPALTDFFFYWLSSSINWLQFFFFFFLGGEGLAFIPFLIFIKMLNF